MPWTGSSVFRSLVYNVFANDVAVDLAADTFKLALYNNSVNPNRDAATAAYNDAVWGTANEVYQAGQWDQGGRVLDGITLGTPVAGVVRFSASNEASGAAATLANVHGSLVYDATVAGNPGVCFLYFGGAQTVTAGTFTVVFNANGIMQFTLT